MNNWQERGVGYFSSFSRYDYFEEMVQKYPDEYTPTLKIISFSDKNQIEIEKDWKQ